MKYVGIFISLLLIIAALFWFSTYNASLPKLNSKGYDRAVVSNQGVIVAWIFENNQKQGLMDTLGNVLIPPKYDYIQHWLEWGVLLTDSGGYDDSAYDYIHYEMNKIGIIDYKGNILFEPQFDIVHFGLTNSVSRALVKKGDKYGFINNKGEFIVDLKLDSASYFINGFAAIKPENKKIGLIDYYGNYIIEPMYDRIQLQYATGFTKDTMYLVLDKKVLMINHKGQIFEPIRANNK